MILYNLHLQVFNYSLKLIHSYFAAALKLTYKATTALFCLYLLCRYASAYY